MLKKKKGLKSQLRQCLQHVSIDLFGYEQLLSEHIVRYLQSTELEPLNRVNVRIGCYDDRPQAYLYYRDECLRAITAEALITFFTGQRGERAQHTAMAALPRIKDYLAAEAERLRIGLDTLTVRIWQPLNNVHVSAYAGDRYLENLPLKTLINYFMP